MIFLFIFFGCEKPQPDLKSLMHNFPLAEIDTELARLNPELNFLRVRIGAQVRRALAYIPGNDLKLAYPGGEKIKFYFGVIPFYFVKHPDPVHMQILALSSGNEQILWSDTISAQANPEWKMAELILPPNSENLILRSDVKDYGLALTPPRILHHAAVQKPSIIFILIDALRADHLGCYGYFRDTSPNIDALSRKGTIFMNVMTTSSFTVTSLSGMFTGLYPWEHRALFCENLVLGEEFPILAQLLRSAGYQTAGFSATYFRLSDFQLDRGFELFDEGCDAKFFMNDAECLTQKVIPWLKSDAEAPFFLYLHYVSTHSPYHPPDEYKKLFSQGILKPKGAAGLGDIQPFGDNRQWYQIPRAPKQTELDWLISQYDGEIRYADTEIGKLLAYLDESGLLDNTLILITADHGEAFFEHRKMDHTEDNHWQTAHIPLILSGPGIPAGKRISSLVRSIDFAPFLLEYAQAGSIQGMSGKSLMPVLNGTETEKRLGFSLMMHTRKKFQIGMVLYPYHFLLWRPADKKMELYDLSSDPNEKNNIADENQELIKQLFTLLPDPDVILSGRRTAKKELSPETKERLKALHYTK